MNIFSKQEEIMVFLHSSENLGISSILKAKRIPSESPIIDSACFYKRLNNP